MTVAEPCPLPATALPAAVYTDPATHARIRERILWRGWHLACHGSQVPELGDYLAFSLLGQDLVAVRGRHGELRCFYNVCQHRGHMLVEGTGRTRVLVCPYHAWSYELDGRLRAAPGSAAVEGFDRGRICLTEVRIESFLGFAFVNLSGDAPPPARVWAGVEAQARALCPGIDARILALEHSAPEFCNWLVAVENYNECYHCGHVHPAFSAAVVDPASYRIRALPGARVLHHSAGAAAGEGRWYDTGGSDYGSFYLWPCFSLQIYPGGLVNTYHWRPEAVADTTVHRGWYSRDGAVDDALQAVIDRDRETTFAEDLKLVKSVQRGLGSRGYRPGPLVVAPGGGIASEHSVAALHGWLADALAEEA